MKTFFHHNVLHVIERLVKSVMNDREVLPLIYKRLSIFDMTSAFCRIKFNLLVLGKKHTWLVNAATNHPFHYIGTVRCINFPLGNVNNAKWKKLLDFIIRYANPGADVFVFRLDSNKRLT